MRACGEYDEVIDILEEHIKIFLSIIMRILRKYLNVKFEEFCFYTNYFADRMKSSPTFVYHIKNGMAKVNALHSL